MKRDRILDMVTRFSCVLALMGCLLLVPQVSFSQALIEFTPGISVSETYDDNIDLDSTHEKSDYITAVSPSLSLAVRSENSDLALRYSPSFVWYDKYSDNDTVRHAGSLSYDQGLSQYLHLSISDVFIKSEEPIEETADIVAVRKDRKTYWRNTGNANLRYIFGPENSLSVGYGQSRLENEDVTIDDSVTHRANTALTYWFDERHGLESHYNYVNAHFTRDDGVQPGDDYDGHGAGAKYLHRFSPHSTGFFGYSYNTRDFDGESEDYDVHSANMGIDHAFSENVSLSASVGYFIQKNDRSGDESGPTYNASLMKQFERGSVTFYGGGGWSESYQDADRTGFTRYNSAGADLQYQLLEWLSAYAGASYRMDKEDRTDRKWKTLRGHVGLSWSFMRWFSMSLSYTHSDRDDDLETEDYTANRVMLTLSGSRLFRW